MNVTSKIEIRAVDTTGKAGRFNFFIDNIALDSMLNINRLTDMRFSDFDLDILEVDIQKFPGYNRLDIVKQAISIFSGITKPNNQFLTDRIVVYRCHCGSDYCGVISLKIDFDDKYVYWTDIRFEIDDNSRLENVKPIKMFQFDKNEYSREFNRYLEKYCATNQG